jgi:transposase
MDLRWFCSDRDEALPQMVTESQLNQLRKEYKKKGNMTVSAMKSGMDRKTARKYLRQSGKSPKELQVKHTWRTRSDPLAQIWEQARQMLEDAPDLEAKTVFEYLLHSTKCGLQESHLRTFQRRVKQWRLCHGPDKEVFFPQVKTPGEVMQLDWTHAAELDVSIQGRPHDHLLCHAVLLYSNWQWATRCYSESLLSLRQGLQGSLFELGKAPKVLQIDNSSAATHQIGVGAQRAFNTEFLSVLEHYGIEARTINVGCPNENGTVESQNGHLKRQLKQHLILRGSRDFASEAQYDRFLHDVLERANGARAEKVACELKEMKDLPPTRLSEYDEVICRVQGNSIIRVKKVGYSVPARLIGSRVKVEIYEATLKIYTGRELLMTLPRVRGDRGAVIDFRHVIDHLLRKPGAFANYRYREELFPSPTYRRAYDRLVEDHGQRRGELEYLHLLKLSAESSIGIPLAMSTNGIESPLDLFLAEGGVFRVESLRRFLGMEPRVEAQDMALNVDLNSYDLLLEHQPEVCDVA